MLLCVGVVGKTTRKTWLRSPLSSAGNSSLNGPHVGHTAGVGQMVLCSWAPAAHLCSHPALGGQQRSYFGDSKEMMGQPGDWLSCAPKSIMSLLDKVKIEMNLRPLGQGSPVQQQVSSKRR